MALIGEMQYLTIGGNTYSLPSGGGGSVTSVAVSNATNGGLSVSGSPISSSGTITIGHSNVLSSAQTTQAVYPIKIDKNGHISAYGTAVTISDTKNTAGSTNSNSKLFLIGATSQAANPQTYSHDTAYVGTDGYLYSNSKKTLVEQYSNNGYNLNITPSVSSSSANFTIQAALDNSGNFYETLHFGSDGFYISNDIDEKTWIRIDDNGTTPVSIIGVKTPTEQYGAANKKYVDDSIPTVNNATLTIQKNGSTVNTFTANASSNVTANITVPTKTSELTNDSGYITNAGVTGVKGNSESSYRTGQVNLTAANIGAAASSHTHSANDLNGGYINIHPENSPIIIPFMHNDIAHLLKRGGSASITYDGTTQTTDISNIFDGSGSYWTVSGSISTIVIELTLHKQFTWSNTIYIDFGSVSWRAKSIKVEAMNTNYTGDTWTSKLNTTGNTLGHVTCSGAHTPAGAANAGGGFNKLRFTFSDFNSISTSGGSFRLSQIGIYNYGSAGLREPYMSRGVDDYVFRNITPNNNNTYNLGSSNYKWANVYATTLNGNVAGTATGNLTSVQYDSTNAKLTYTKNGSNTDIVTVATLKSALGSMPASDVYSWAKASSKPTYTASEVGALASNTTYVSTITTTAGTHSAISSKSGAVSFNVPTKTSHLTNDSGFLTSHQDISGKIDTAGTGLSKSGTTLNHSNSVTAQTTQAVYPIKIDAQGHISAYGSAQTILSIGTTSSTAAAGNHTHDIGLGSTTDTTSGVTLASATKYKLTAGGKSVYFTMPTIPTVSYPVTSVNSKTGAVSLTASDVGALASSTTYVSTVTTTAGAHTAISNKSGAVSFNVPTTAAHVGAATSDHTHGNITNGGDITATAPTIVSGDQIIINDDSASKITNGPTFDGSTTTKALSQKGTWETFSNSLLYGTCSTAAATVAKTVTVNSSFKLVTGATVAVKFSNTNTADAPTLNVNSTGAKALMRKDSTYAGTSSHTSWVAGETVPLLYDGSSWLIMNNMAQNNCVTQSYSSSNTDYNLALSAYTSTNGGATTLNHSNKIKGNPSTGRIITSDLSDDDIDTFVSLLNYSQINAVDYVVEEGTSGSWKYRKWNSGIGECWLQYNPGSYTVGTARSSLYSGANLTLTFPIAFTSTPTVTGNVSLGTDAYVVWLQFNGLGTSTAQCRIVSSGSVAANSNYLISVYAIGEWK